jgi:hypothetical protein
MVNFGKNPPLLTLGSIDHLTYDPNHSGVPQISRTGDPPFGASYARPGVWANPRAPTILLAYGTFAAGSRQGYDAPAAPSIA